MPALLALLALVAALSPPPPSVAAAATVERQGHVMGTRMTMRVTAADRTRALGAAEAAWRELEAAEARLSTWGETSELARLNAAPVGRPVTLSPALAAELDAAAECRRLTAGGFDPGVGALVAAWGLRDGGRIPSPAELDTARGASGWRHLDLRDGVAVRRHAGLVLEEGGFGKGAGLDRAIAALAAAGATGWVDLGGQLATTGGDSLVTVADPAARQRPAVSVRLDAGSLATSGNGERGFAVAGRRLGHLLDPRSGEPAPDFGSLTVWAPSALVADCLATGLYVLGPRRALEVAAALPEVEAMALIVLPDGGIRAEVTAGLVGRVVALAPTVERVVHAASAADVRKEREQEATDA